MSPSSEGTSISERIRSLLEEIEYIQVVGHPREVPPQAGVFEPVPDQLHPKVAKYLQDKYPQGLYRHQSQAIISALAGHHTIVTTKTSSGKSVIFLSPVVDSMLRDEKATGLFIYPTRALANDQYLSLRDALGAVGIYSLDNLKTSVAVKKYDGSTEQHHRKPIREHGRAILTNPDMLHIGILGNHELWDRFFRHLKYVVIDEAHEYRGVFGSNVAYLMRRVRQICRLYGSDPVFIATSATCKNPLEHARNLTGLEFSLIGSDQDGSIQGHKTYFLTQSRGMPHIDAAANLAMRLTLLKLSSLTFCPSRMSAEKKFYSLVKRHSDLTGLMEVYRAGLSAAHREKIESRLKERSLLGVLCTNALELGIDVGQLDVVVMVGFPHTMMSMWQRAGRVGRAGKEGVVIVLSSNNPVDRFFLNHQDVFYARENEPLTLTLTNQTIVTGHFACARKEMGGDHHRLDPAIFGPPVVELAKQFDEGLANDRSILFQDVPHAEVTIRGIQDYTYRICHGADSIGEIGSSQILREAYPYATYFHGGQKYRVKAIIDGEKKVVVAPDPSAPETRALRRVDISNAKKLRIREFDGVTICYGDLVVRETVGQCYEVDEAGEATGVNHTFKPRVRTFPSVGTWVDLSPAFLSKLGMDLTPEQVQGGVHALEHMLAQMLTVLVPCDANDYSSTYLHRKAENNYTIYIYDNVHGGIGLSRSAFDLFQTLVARATEAMEACSCTDDEGCPFCIQQSGCSAENANLSKRGALDIAEALQTTTALPPNRDLDFTHEAQPGPVVILNVGETVFHPKFGVGSVTEATPAAEDAPAKWVVTFESGRAVPFADPKLLSKVETGTLKTCSACGERCPSAAASCPQCGNPL